MSEFREDCLHGFFILPPSSGCFRPSRRLLILLCNLSWPTPCAKECSPLDRGISDTRGCLYFSLLLISLRPPWDGLYRCAYRDKRDNLFHAPRRCWDEEFRRFRREILNFRWSPVLLFNRTLTYSIRRSDELFIYFFTRIKAFEPEASSACKRSYTLFYRGKEYDFREKVSKRVSIFLP